MKIHSIITYSAVLIAIFALLYYFGNPEPKPKSEVKNFLSRYEGKRGFAILKMPDFLLGELMQSDSLTVSKENFVLFRIMIQHEDENGYITCDETENKLTLFLDSLKFEPVLEKDQEGSVHMKIFQKYLTEKWKENVTMYTSDSTLFLFNFISNINDEQVVHFSDHLSNQNIL